MVFRLFLSLFLWVAFFASPEIASAKTSNSAVIRIRVIVPERAENQKCIIGFNNSIDNTFISMQNSGCRYNSKALLQTAYQQVMKKNSQGFITVVITAP